ncbi:MAG TPA: fatty acid desaturase [Planctomycetota bacterium]|nr:fatty acid desaturase [Planctomycetota bacterium]
MKKYPVYWENILFLALTHLAGLAGIVYAALVYFSPWTLGLAGLWLTLCMLSTTGGYHRLFAHRAYRATPALRLFYLLFGAASFQGPALRWASDHRVHHAQTDEEQDPHSIRRGFWWAHIGWLFYRTAPTTERSRDLLADRLVCFQDRFYLPLGLLMGLVGPSLLAWTWGDPLGGLLLAGFLRLLLQYHATFAINSVAHTIGRRPYSTTISARDSFVTAFLTLGEGYHNYHHRFPGDYRNGYLAHHFDPTKWWIWTLSKLGLAGELHRASLEAIRRARESAQSPS